MTCKNIPLLSLLTVFAACSEPVGGFYPSRLNGVSIASQQSATDAQKAVSQIEVNNKELASINAELKKQAEQAERDSAALARRR